MKHLQRPEFLLLFDDRGEIRRASSVASAEAASAEPGQQRRAPAHEVSFLLQPRPPPPALKQSASPGTVSWTSVATQRRIRLCFAPEQVRLFARPLFRTIRFTADQNEQRTVCVCAPRCRVRRRVCALKTRRLNNKPDRNAAVSSHSSSSSSAAARTNTACVQRQRAGGVGPHGRVVI